MTSVEEVPPIWRTELPDAWPELPAPMSYSVLRAMENCPRQWALSRASYGSVWNGKGYPDRLYVGTLVGQVVHGALEKIVQAVNRVSEATAADEIVVTALRTLGGYATVLDGEVERFASRAEANPRVANAGRDVREELRQRGEAMRRDLQLLVSRVRRNVVGGVRASQGGAGERPRAVRDGPNAEVTMSDAAGFWKGIADLIVVNGEAVEIVDFKTGEPKPDHSDQLHLYGWLFLQDDDVNPRRLPVVGLRVVYREREEVVEVPSDAEWQNIAAALGERARVARLAVSAASPEARPSEDVCRFCGVRQLCSDYWTRDGHMRASGAGGTTETVDCEVELHEQTAASTWRATVVCGGGVAAGENVLVRVPRENACLVGTVIAARRARLLSCRLTQADAVSAAPTVLALGRMSEVFVVA